MDRSERIKSKPVQGLLFDNSKPVDTEDRAQKPRNESLKNFVLTAKSTPIDGQVSTLGTQNSDTVTIPRAHATQGTFEFRAVKVPSSIDEFAGQFNIDCIKRDNDGSCIVRYREGQVEFATLYNTNSRDYMVQAPTGSGKTITALLAVAPAISRGESIVILAPTRPLCDQWGKRIAEFLNVPEESIAILSGDHQRVNSKKRLEAYRNEGIKILITTPEAFQRDLDKIEVSKIKHAIIDEGDEIVKEDASVQCSEVLHENGVRRVIFSALFKEKKKDLDQMCRDLKATFFPLMAPPHCITFDKSWCGVESFSDDHRSLVLTQPLGLLSDTMKGLAEMLVYNPHFPNLAAATYQTCFDGSMAAFLPPTYNKVDSIISALSEEIASAKIEYGRIPVGSKEYINAAYALAHLPYLYETLSTSGVLSFLDLVAKNIIYTRMGIDLSASPKKGNAKSVYRVALYGSSNSESSAVLKSFDSLSEGQLTYAEDGSEIVNTPPTLYRTFLKANSIHEALESFKDVPEYAKLKDTLEKDPDSPKNKKKVLKMMLEICRKELSDRGIGWSNHPKEDRLCAHLENYFSIRGQEGSVIVYTYHVQHAFYLADRLKLNLARYGVDVSVMTGTSHQTSSQRDANFEGFLNQRSQVLVMTDVGKKGIDTTAEQIAIYNMPWTPRDLIQLLGRIRNHGTEVPHYNDPVTGKSVSMAHAVAFLAVRTSDTFRLAKSTAALKTK